ncbi:ABC-three component system protein [Staphylococcus equorum]|uniref:ABC-three component system protein n=1 Tax=Staphylococcus equorum TaxID=246432 RepID=UPI003CF9B217
MNKRNATASWSGYLHQGKVGILVTLIKINHLLDKESSLQGWIVEYESAEDIDIKNDGIVDSRHQVKANKEGTYPNDYKDVLLRRKTEIKGGKEKIIRPGFQIDYEASGKTLEVKEGARFLHTIKEVKGFELDEEAFQNRYRKSNYIKNQNRIQLYTYPDGEKFCDILDENEDKILGFCKDEIEKILSREQNHPFKTDANEHRNIFKHLLWILDEQIRIKHYQGSDFFPVIEFEKIHNVIISTTRYKQSNLNKIREVFSESWAALINEISDDELYTDEKIEEVNKLLQKLYALSEEDFIQFLKNINPDKNQLKDFSDITDIFKVCDEDSFKDIFYECLLLVTEQDFDLTYKGYRSETSNSRYLLTLIGRPKKRVNTIIENMKKNEEVTDDIFNREYLINRSIDGIKFGEDIITSPEKDGSKNNWNKDIDEKEKFYNPSLEFISVDNAIKKLNER